MDCLASPSENQGMGGAWLRALFARGACWRHSSPPECQRDSYLGVRSRRICHGPTRLSTQEFVPPSARSNPVGQNWTRAYPWLVSWKTMVRRCSVRGDGSGRVITDVYKRQVMRLLAWAGQEKLRNWAGNIEYSTDRVQTSTSLAQVQDLSLIHI